MTTTIPHDSHGGADSDGVEDLYLRFLKAFYEDGDPERSHALASRLEQALAASPDQAGSIRAEEIRSLLAELRGDLAEAARSREAEIRKILELHSLTINTPGWEYVARQYSFSDVSDRLDLLAILYDEQGDLERAVATLLESKHYCQAHQIPFDGQDLLDELEQARQTAVEQGPVPEVSREILDGAVRRAYRQFGLSAERIVRDPAQSRRFTDEVRRHLPEGAAVSVPQVKRRLLALRRRGQTGGGLPRLRG